jgi:hypothetical protein
MSLDRDTVVISALLVVFATQYIFYFGKWPEGANPRYLFPGMLVEHLAIFVFLIALVRLVGFGKPRPIWACVGSIAASASFMIVAVGDIKTNRAVSKQVVAATTSFTDRLNEAVGFLRLHPSMGVILNSHDIWDYEPTISIGRYIRSAGLPNPMALKANGYRSAAFSKGTMQFFLTDQLEKLQAVGGKGFSPLQSVDSAAGCFSFGFNGPPLAECLAGVTVWP